MKAIQGYHLIKLARGRVRPTADRKSLEMKEEVGRVARQLAS